MLTAVQETFDFATQNIMIIDVLYINLKSGVRFSPLNIPPV